MIQKIITVILVIIPITILMLYVNERDKKEKEPIVLIILMMILGMISVYISKEVWNIIVRMIPEIKEEVTNVNWYARILISYGEIGFIEESIKYIIVNIVIYRNRNYDYMYDGIVYTVAMSLGFALVEGIEYGIGNGIAISLFRSILTIPMHMVYGVLMGYYLSESKIGKKNIYYR